MPVVLWKSLRIPSDITLAVFCALYDRAFPSPSRQRGKVRLGWGSPLMTPLRRYRLTDGSMTWLPIEVYRCHRHHHHHLLRQKAAYITKHKSLTILLLLTNDKKPMGSDVQLLFGKILWGNVRFFGEGHFSREEMSGENWPD